MRRNSFLSGLLVLGIGAVCLQAQADPLWAQCYKGIRPGLNQSNALALDGNDHVFVAGSAYITPGRVGFVTLKYDSDGTPLWTRTYTGPGKGGDVVTAMVVDDNGCAYVTGASDGGATHQDITTIKYDPRGRLLWLQRYDGGHTGDDAPTAMALDTYGDLYVTGWSWGGGGTGYDYVTLKYDPFGKKLWTRRYNGPGNNTDVATALVVSPDGNLYITGYSHGGLTTFMDYATLKYDPTGALIWTKRYNGPGNRNDQPNALALDDSGALYVTGTSVGSGTGADYATLKYDANGAQLWVRRYNGPANLSDQATALGIDSEGSVYVAGSSATGLDAYGEFLADYAVVKYGSNGKQIWVGRCNRSADAYAYPTAILVGAVGDVYLTGTVADYSVGVTSATFDYFTAHFDWQGQVAWGETFHGAANLDDQASALVQDSTGCLYVTGRSGWTHDGNGLPLYSCATLKYAP